MKVKTTTLESMAKPDPQRVLAMQGAQAESAKRYGWNRDIEQAIKLKYFPDPSTRP